MRFLRYITKCRYNFIDALVVLISWYLITHHNAMWTILVMLLGFIVSVVLEVWVANSDY